MTFIRYADDWVVLLYDFSKDEAQAMKAKIAEWRKHETEAHTQSRKELDYPLDGQGEIPGL